MTYLIITNPHKKTSERLASSCTRFLEERNLPFSLCRIEEVQCIEAASASCDLAIVIGGDGTILRAIHAMQDVQLPVIGINMGKLGFMTDVMAQDLEGAMEDLVEGRFTIQERLILEAQLQLPQEQICFHALNEIVLHRAQNPNLVSLDVRVNGSYLTSYSADGLIAATPTGSTAYSLSAGGPIIAPDLSTILLTPISPHTLSNRPIVLDAQSEVLIEVQQQSTPVDLIIDGALSQRLEKQSALVVSASRRPFRWIALSHYNYFNTLRTKLGWRGKM